MNYFFLFIILLVASCSSKSERDDAAYWKARYMALRSFVDGAGLGPAAERSLKRSLVVATVYVQSEGYLINKVLVTSGEALTRAVNKIKVKDDEVVDIIISKEASHEQLLKLLDKLNRHGLKNFNLIREDALETVP